MHGVNEWEAFYLFWVWCIFLFYLLKINFLFYFCVSWLLYIKQQSSETATSWQREIRIHWKNPWWNKMLDFLYYLLEIVFSDLDSKIVFIKLTTDEEKIRRWSKELRENFSGEACRQQIKWKIRKTSLSHSMCRRETFLQQYFKGDAKEENEGKSHKNRKSKWRKTGSGLDS